MGGPEAGVAIRLLFESSRGLPRLRVKQQMPAPRDMEVGSLGVWRKTQRAG